MVCYAYSHGVTKHCMLYDCFTTGLPVINKLSIVQSLKIQQIRKNECDRKFSKFINPTPKFTLKVIKIQI